MKDRAIQGNADGLCGLYALINFLILQKITDFEEGLNAKQHAFRYLIESAERLGLLTSSRLLRGYEWPELVEIFNHFADRYCIGFKAIGLNAICDELASNNNSSVLDHIVSSGGAAVVLVERGNHWVLVSGRVAKGFAFIDPSYKPKRLELKKTSNIRVGVALMPIAKPELL